VGAVSALTMSDDYDSISRQDDYDSISRQAVHSMPFVRRHWYSLGLAVAGISAWWAFAGAFTTVQRILLLNFIVLLLHQFEEYAWPGGEPWIINEVMQPKGNRPDRYPLNQNNAFIINVPLAYSFYLLPVFFPEAVWVGLAANWIKLTP
jgi:hypothetical protein